MKCRFWGTRAVLAVPGLSSLKLGGNTSCLSVSCGDGALVVFDAGTGLRDLGGHLFSQRLTGWQVHLFLSRLRWDHVQGLPFFGPAYVPGNRLHLHGPPESGRGLEEVLRDQMEYAYFPITPEKMEADLSYQDLEPGAGGWEAPPVELAPLRLRALRLASAPDPCLGYRLEEGGRALVYLGDVEGVPPQPGPSAAGPDLAAFARGCDLLVLGPTPARLSEGGGAGQASVASLVGIALAAEARRLALTRYDPLQEEGDLDGWIRAAQALAGSRLEVLAASEGLEVAL